MLQRKQTIYIILIIALFTPLFFVDLASYEIFGFMQEGDQLLSLNLFSSGSMQTIFPLTILLVLIIVNSFFVIGLFKNGVVQLRLSIFLILLIIGFIAMETYCIYDFYNKVGEVAKKAPAYNSVVNLVVFLPIPALFFSYLAFKSIAKDLVIIRSYRKMR